jgi:predicted O-methyltransferase YrrM
MNLDDAMELVRKGDQAKALDIYNQIIRNEPNNLNAYGHRAWLFLSKGDYENALEDYLHILEINPGEKEAKRRIADILYQLGDREKAVKLMKDLLGEDPLDRTSLEICLGWTPAAQDEKSREGRSGSGLKPLNPVIEAIEKTMFHESSSSRPEEGRFLYSFVRMLKPGIVVETGTFVGYSSLCIAQALEDNGENGHLHSFDLFQNLPENYRSPLCPDTSNSLHVVRTHLGKAGLSSRVTLHQGDSAGEIENVFPDKKPCIDMAYIDGDHTLKGCIADWNVVAERLQPGGIVLLHDVEPRKVWWLLGPPCLVSSITSCKPGRFSVLSLPTPGGAGLGIIQKTDESRHKRWSPSIPALAREFLMRTINRISKK